MLVPLNIPSYEAENGGGGTNFKNITISCNQIMLHQSCVFLFDNKDTFGSLDLTGSSINECGRSGSNLQDFTNVCALSTVSDERSLKCTHWLIYLVLKSSSIVCHYFNNSDKKYKKHRFPSFSKAVLKIPN